MFDLESEFFEIPHFRKIYFNILVCPNDFGLFPHIKLTVTGKNVLLHYFFLKTVLQAPKI